LAEIPPILCIKLVSPTFRRVEIKLLLKPSLMTRNERRFRNTGKGWTLPDRNLDLLASIDLLSRDPKNLQFTLNVS